MLIPNIPADWWSMVEPINRIWEELQTTQDRLRILTNYIDVLEKRVKELEVARIRSSNSKVARKKLQDKTHWVTQAKRDLDILKESRKRQKLSVKTKLNGITLYREVRKYINLAKKDTDKANQVLETIFGN